MTLEQAQEITVHPAYEALSGRRMGDLDLDSIKRITSDRPPRGGEVTHAAALLLLKANKGELPPELMEGATQAPERPQRRPPGAVPQRPAPQPVAPTAPVTVHVTQQLPLMPCGHPIQVVKENNGKSVCLWCRSNQGYERRIRQLEEQIQSMQEDLSGSGEFDLPIDDGAWNISGATDSSCSPTLASEPSEPVASSSSPPSSSEDGS